MLTSSLEALNSNMSEQQFRGITSGATIQLRPPCWRAAIKMLSGTTERFGEKSSEKIMFFKRGKHPLHESNWCTLNLIWGQVTRRQ